MYMEEVYYRGLVGEVIWLLDLVSGLEEGIEEDVIDKTS